MPGTTGSPRVRRFAPPTPPHGLPCFVRQLHRYYHRIGPLFNVHPPISISPTLRRLRPWRWALKRSPRSRQDMYIRPWGLRHRGPVRPLTITMTNILPSTAPIISATRTTHLSLLNIPGHMRRYRHFTSTLTSDRARLAEICAWFLLHITGLPPAIPCQLAWRTPFVFLAHGRGSHRQGTSRILHQTVRANAQSGSGGLPQSNLQAR